MLHIGLTVLILAAPALATDPVAAIVNGEVIRLAVVDAVVQRARPDTPLTAAQTRALRESVLDELIGELLVSQYLARNTPAPDRREIDAQMALLVEAQKSMGKTLAQYCRETGFSEAQLRASFEADLRWRRHIAGTTGEADYRQHFEANRDVFEGTKVRLSHILLRVPSGAKESESNVTRETLRRLKADIEASRFTFAEAAKKHSICVSAEQGGDLGVIRRKDGLVEEALSSAAFALPVGGISEPVRTPLGWHLLTITARMPGPSRTYAQCVEAVQESYAEEARARLIARLRAEANVKISLP